MLWFIEIMVIILELPIISQTSITLNYGPIKIESRVSKPLRDARVWGDLSIVNQSFSHGNLVFVVVCSREKMWPRCTCSILADIIASWQITPSYHHIRFWTIIAKNPIDINEFHHVAIDSNPTNIFEKCMSIKYIKKMYQVNASCRYQLNHRVIYGFSYILAPSVL